LTKFAVIVAVILGLDSTKGTDLSGEALSVRFLDDKEALGIEGPNLGLQIAWAEPEVTSDVETGEWTRSDSDSVPYRLAGMSGSLRRRVLMGESMKVTREIWVSRNRALICARQTIANLGEDPFGVEALYPISIDGAEGFRFGFEDAAHWRVLAQLRYKNDRPATFIPHPGLEIEADPFLVLRDEREGSHLLIGYLSHYWHKASIDLAFRGEGNAVFSSLKAYCDFEGTALPPRGSRSSQWVYISLGQDANRMIDAYADRVGRFHSVEPPQDRPPSVYCTWYYHADEYNGLPTR